MGGGPDAARGRATRPGEAAPADGASAGAQSDAGSDDGADPAGLEWEPERGEQGWEAARGPSEPELPRAPGQSGAAGAGGIEARAAEPTCHGADDGGAGHLGPDPREADAADQGRDADETHHPPGLLGGVSHGDQTGSASERTESVSCPGGAGMHQAGGAR